MPGEAAGEPSDAGAVGVAEAEKLAEEFLRSLLSITPGFNRLTLMLHLLHKRVEVRADALKAFLGEEAVEAVKNKNMDFLRVYLNEDEGTVSLRIAKAGWYLVELLRELAWLIERIEWPERLKRRYVCLVKAVPAALYVLATLRAVEESLEERGVAKGLSRALSEAFAKAAEEGVQAFTMDELKGLGSGAIAKFIEDYGKESLDEILDALSSLGAFNYAREPGIILLDVDVVEGLKKAKECDPQLEEIGTREIEEWFNKVTGSLT